MILRGCKGTFGGLLFVGLVALRDIRILVKFRILGSAQSSMIVGCKRFLSVLDFPFFHPADDVKRGEALIVRPVRVRLLDFPGNDVKVIVHPHLCITYYYRLL